MALGLAARPKRRCLSLLNDIRACGTDDEGPAHRHATRHDPFVIWLSLFEQRWSISGGRRGQQLVPMIQRVVANVGSKPIAVSADAGYWSANVTDESVAGVDRHIATGRQRRGEKVETVSGPPPEGASPCELMAHKLGTEAGRAIYKMRKAIVEPVFSHIKERRGFRRFSFWGLGYVGQEWKLFRSGWSPQTVWAS